MNKQELIKKYKKLEGVWDAEGAEIARRIFLQDLEQLDEPKPVVVPQFVADVIEGAREKSPELEDALHYPWFNGTKEFTEWYNKKSNRDLFARAWLDGYTIEEKRYQVKMKGISSLFRHLKYNFLTEKWYMGNDAEDKNVKKTHTRKEIEDAGFGEVFNSSLFEVEEVK